MPGRPGLWDNPMKTTTEDSLVYIMIRKVAKMDFHEALEKGML